MTSLQRCLIKTIPFQLVAISSLFGQPVTPYSLLKLLSNPETSRQGVDLIKSSGSKYVPLLLKWTKNPPKDDIALMGIHRVGLADAFGELKVKEAIPFLLENIDMNREVLHSVAMGAEERYQADIKNKPAMTALIKIAELEPLQYAYRQNRLTWREREEVLIVICEIAETKSETYLLSLKAGLKQDLEKDLNRINESLRKISLSKQKNN